MTDITKMTGRQLVEEHNRLAAILGLPDVGRFATREAGVRRVQRLTERHASEQVRAVVTSQNVSDISMSEMTTVEVMEQLRTSPEADKKMRAAAAGPTIRQITDEYNALVPEAQALGVRARHHSSLFESKALGQRQLDKLKADLAAAREAAAQ